MQRIRIADRAIQTQGLRPTCLEVGRRLRIATREQNNVMSERNQFVGQPRNNALGASIKLGRNGLGQRGYLRDLHPVVLSSSALQVATEKGALPAQALNRTAPARPSREPTS